MCVEDQAQMFLLDNILDYFLAHVTFSFLRFSFIYKEIGFILFKNLHLWLWNLPRHWVGGRCHYLRRLRSGMLVKTLMCWFSWAFSLVATFLFVIWHPRLSTGFVRGRHTHSTELYFPAQFILKMCVSRLQRPETLALTAGLTGGWWIRTELLRCLSSPPVFPYLCSAGYWIIEFKQSLHNIY